MTDSNFTSKQLLQEKQFKAILAETTYTLSNSQYQELERIAALYESLHTLLGPFENDAPVSNISCLFTYLNESLYRYIDTLRPD